jgi:hypothetical protein
MEVQIWKTGYSPSIQHAIQILEPAISELNVIEILQLCQNKTDK